ncbi:hypothetical protein F4861DRAFT_536406 [Xylaria intraflava]|nr:hypothetical protein F4861DRAFT_536406 [Xylaria intraflava]
MSDKKARDEGDYFPFAKEESPTAAPTAAAQEEQLPDLPSTIPSTADSDKGPAHRGHRFSKLSDAYSHITSRVPHTRPANLPHQACLPEDARTPPSSSGNARVVKSQDDLQLVGSLSGARSPIGRNRSASFTTVDFFGDLPPMMSRNRVESSLGHQIDRELASIRGPTHDTSGSTIEKIVAQYHGPTVDGDHEQDDVKERRIKANPYISEPPEDSLPAIPSSDEEPAAKESIQQPTYESPIADSTVTDSQHLLDADAQARELEEARQADVPEPLNVTQPSTDVRQDVRQDVQEAEEASDEAVVDPLHLDEAQPSTDVQQDQQYKGQDESSDFIVHDNEDPANNPFDNRRVQGYKTYLEAPLQRDISRKLRNAGSAAERSARTFLRSNAEAVDAQQASIPEEIYTQSSLNTASPENRRSRLRDIRVVIGQATTSEKAPAVCDTSDVASDDGDWVTETSDAGAIVENSSEPLPERTPMGYKKAGSSLADYSDDGNEEAQDNFGSQERIIQYPDGKSRYQQYQDYDVQRSKDNKFSVLLPRKRDTAPPESSSRRFAGGSKRESRQFRPQLLAAKTSNPYREIGEPKRPERLQFNFDQNEPPRFAFRDSMSEYEPAGASTKANYGTEQSDVPDCSPRPVSGISETSNYETHSLNDARFDEAPRMEANITNFDGLCLDNPYCPSDAIAEHRDETERAALEREQQEERDRIGREFANSSAFREPPSSVSTIKSKFGFQLVTLNEAQRKNKMQRQSGQTNETETGLARMRRFRNSQSTNAASSPIEPPQRVFLMHRDLSTTFSPTDDTQSIELDDQSTPHPIGRFSYGTPSSNQRRRRTQSWLGIPGTASFGSSPFFRRQGRDGRTSYYPTPNDRRQRRIRPGYIAPDDYVSDRADRIRRVLFWVIVFLSLFPVFGMLALRGYFSLVFQWATRGEVDQLTRRQRCALQWILISEGLVYLGAVVAVSTYFGNINSGRH